MLSNRLLISVRLFNTSCVVQNNARVMKKIMGTTKKKRHYTESPILPNATSFSKGAYEGKQSVNTKRVAVLNKLFMRYITDLMLTGECSTAFAGYNIEIQRVQVTPDFNFINVYWIAQGDKMDEEIEKLLHANSGLLRHELSQLKVIGIVPMVKFLKDKKLAQIMEVDMRLAQADFGDDYIPTEPAARLKSQLQLYTKLSPQLQKQIEELNEEVEAEETYDIPEMSHNVFALDHAAIMNKLCKKISRNIIKEGEAKVPTIEHEINEKPVRNNMGKEELKDFLFKRQLLQKKLKRLDKKQTSEREILQEEFEQATKHKYFFDEYINDDYIDEDELK